MLVGAGLALPPVFTFLTRIGWRELIVGGLITAMGFSVGLFFCTALFPRASCARKPAWACC